MASVLSKVPAILVFFLCFGVVAQIMGTPTSLHSLLAGDQSRESASEDISVAMVAEHASVLRDLPTCHEQPDYSLYHPVFVTILFRPPQA
jgi:hypothetical protein